MPAIQIEEGALAKGALVLPKKQTLRKKQSRVATRRTSGGR